MESQLEKKKGGRPKRSTVPVSEPSGSGWDCSVCTYNNSAEAFKCSMCDTRKGTSTRKPRTNQQQALIHQASIQLTKKEKNMRKQRPARLKNIDRNSAQHTVVTVGEVTVIITDYKPKPAPDASTIDDSLADDISYYDHSSDTDLSDYH